MPVRTLTAFVLLTLLQATVLPLGACYALNLDKIKVHILNNDYKSAITEGERLLAVDAGAAHSDELYYFMGISYLKEGNYLRASDIFEIILSEFEKSPLKEKAQIGLADTYFLRGEFGQARLRYEQALTADPQGELAASLYYRLSQVALKQGDTQSASSYLSKLRSDYPLNPELQQSIEICSLPPPGSDIYYSVQVGSFINAGNASNLRNKLKDKGYDAYTEEVDLSGKTTYRVKVGKLKSRPAVEQLADKLSAEGYPTRVCP